MMFNLHHERVRKFAEAQLKNYGQDFEVELSEGLFAGQRLIPVNTLLDVMFLLEDMLILLLQL